MARKTGNGCRRDTDPSDDRGSSLAMARKTGFGCRSFTLAHEVAHWVLAMARKTGNGCRFDGHGCKWAECS